MFDDNGFREVLQSFWGADVAVRLYHNEGDFISLWQFDEGLLGTKDSPTKHVLIFWSGFPSASASRPDSKEALARTNNYVSPYHWAVALAVHCTKSGWSSMPRVIVVHWLPEANRRHLDEYGRLCRSISAAVPWLLGMSLLDPATGENLQPLGRGIGDGPVEVPDNNVLELLRAAFRRQITDDPDDRHTIANVIGPSLLAAGVGVADPCDRKKSPSRWAMVQLMSKHEWLHASVSSVGLRQDASKRLRKGASSLLSRDPLRGLAANGDAGGIRYYLLDDQANAGFGEVLSSLLKATSPKQGASPFSMVCSETPDELIGWLESIGTQGTAAYLDKVDVLFLDLRLWLEKMSGDHAKSVLRKVAQLADDRADLYDASDPQLSSALRAAKRAAQGESLDQSQELAALTLLPLLVSHADPSLPVVIFSSTRQREVVSRFQHRPNIWCQFTKPSLPAGHRAATDREMQANAMQLVSAILGALGNLRFRPLWDRIVSLNPNPPEYKTDHFNVGLAISRKKWGYNQSLGRNAWETVTQWNDACFQYTRESIVRRLRALFFRLLAGEFDSFLSGCYELIEGGYSTDDQKFDSYSIELRLPITNIDLDDPAVFQQYRFTMLAEALKTIRNYKAHALHCHSDPAWDEGESIKFAAAGMLLVLVDFIEQRAEVEFLVERSPSGTVLRRGTNTWNIKQWAPRNWDTAFVLSVLMASLDAAVGVNAPHPTRPSGAPKDFFSAELMDLCNAIVVDEVSYLPT